MTYYAVQIANGKWMSRGRFGVLWDGSFQLHHPELFDTADAAHAAAAGEDHPIVVPFAIVPASDSPTGSKDT